MKFSRAEDTKIPALGKIFTTENTEYTESSNHWRNFSAFFQALEPPRHPPIPGGGEMIPKGWKKSKISKVAVINVGRDLKEDAFSENKTDTHIYPVYSNTVENRGLYGYYNFQEYDGNSLTVVGRGAGLGTAFARNSGFGAIGRLLVISPKEDFDVRYFAEYVNNMLCLFHESGGIPQLPGDAFGKYEIILPPLPEQKAIAEVLSVWDRAIEKTERLIQAKQKQFSWLMNSLINSNEKSSWKKVKLGDVFEAISRKNSIGETNVLTSSAQHGLVSQLDYYNKSVSAENVTGYYLLKRGEFAYNRSSSNGYPLGAIKRLNNYEQGVLSTLYLCFQLKPDTKCNSDFFLNIFESGILNRQLREICQEGARSHGLLNITKSDFYGLLIPLPPLADQKRVAETLNLAQREIDLLKKLAEKQKLQKRGLMQKLLTGEWRTGDTGIAETTEKEI